MPRIPELDENGKLYEQAIPETVIGSLVAAAVEDDASATRTALNAAYTTLNTSALVDFTTKPDGAAPTVLDTGQPVDTVFDATGKSPVVLDGRLVHGALPASGAFADYYQAQLGVKAQRIGTQYVQPSGADDGNGVMCLAAWASVYEGSGSNVPSARCHLIIQPGTGTTGTWQYGVYRGDGSPLVVVRTGTITNPPADGATPWTVEVTFDEDRGDAYVFLPDGQVATITAAQISAAFTTAGQTPVALRDLGGEVVMVEHFASTGGNTAKYAEFEKLWAETTTPPRHRTAVSPRVLARSLDGVRNSVLAATTAVEYAPTTLGSVATTTSAANVDATNAKITAQYGPSGKVLIELDLYYEFTSEDRVFVRLAGTPNTATRVAAYGVAGQKSRIHHSVLITGGTPGVSANWTLQQWSVVAGSATLKYGGSGGGMLPPLSLKATPL